MKNSSLYLTFVLLTLAMIGIYMADAEFFERYIGRSLIAAGFI